MIPIYIFIMNMTLEQHTEGRNRLRDVGAPESAMKLHSCFGEDGQLQVFDVWESQEAFDEFLTYLGPVMEELGIDWRSRPRSCRLWTLSSNSTEADEDHESGRGFAGLLTWLSSRRARNRHPAQHSARDRRSARSARRRR